MKLYIEDNEAIPAALILEDGAAVPNDHSSNPFLDKSQSLDFWEAYARSQCTDYEQLRTRVIEQLDIKTWANLSVAEKDYCVAIDVKKTSVNDSTDETNKTTHIVAQGQAADTDAAKVYLAGKWAESKVKQSQACADRVNSKMFLCEIRTYLSNADADDFFVTTFSQFFMFKEQGVSKQLFDYIQSQGDYASTGLASKSYTMQNGDSDETNFIAAMLAVLKDGKY